MNINYGFMKRKLSLSKLIISAAALTVAQSVWAAPTGYHAVNLGSLNNQQSEALDVNSSNTAVGWSSSNTKAKQAVMWKDGAIVTLNDFGGSQSMAIAVNNANQAVGVTALQTSNGSEIHVVLWQNGASEIISTAEILFGSSEIPPSDITRIVMYPQITSNSSVNLFMADINDAGQVVMFGAYQYRCTTNPWTGLCWGESAFVYENGSASMIPIGSFGKSSSLRINSTGKVVASGAHTDSSGKVVIAGQIYDSNTGAISLLPNFADCNSSLNNMPADINDNGIVVGTSCMFLPSGVKVDRRGYIGNASGITDMGFVGTNPENYVLPNAINNAGLSVGTAVDKRVGTGTFNYPAVYDAADGLQRLDQMVDNIGDMMLGTLSARGVSDTNVVVGGGRFNVNSFNQAVMFIPALVCP